MLRFGTENLRHLKISVRIKKNFAVGGPIGVRRKVTGSASQHFCFLCVSDTTKMQMKGGLSTWQDNLCEYIVVGDRKPQNLCVTSVERFYKWSCLTVWVSRKFCKTQRRVTFHLPDGSQESCSDSGLGDPEPSSTASTTQPLPLSFPQEEYYEQTSPNSRTEGDGNSDPESSSTPIHLTDGFLQNYTSRTIRHDESYLSLLAKLQHFIIKTSKGGMHNDMRCIPSDNKDVHCNFS
ncbi:Protocadherin-11 X-linked [Collichthys lucidus]|uniref:Protocadherin-11 X-linked n=1 Tax=Collichthys lucidus TaxID=240159 RepID=A0A4U5UCL1_COLLU|nr:Protocadherin-11 X-linked [Collichthys lucidus]